MQNYKQWLKFFWRITSCHIVSYFLMGLLALLFLNYADRFTSGSLALFMRPTDSPWVALGPLLQIVRGLIFSIVLWPIKEIIVEKSKGWLILWGLFLGLAILGTSGPTPGSVEGVIYTTVSLKEHLFGLPEVVLQTLILSLGIYNWYKKPSKIWNIAMGILVIVIMFMSLGGYFSAIG